MINDWFPARYVDEIETVQVIRIDKSQMRKGIVNIKSS